MAANPEYDVRFFSSRITQGCGGLRENILFFFVKESGGKNEGEKSKIGEIFEEEN